MKKLYIETYGCQMNFADSEVVASVLVSQSYLPVFYADEADLILINTCSIRNNAEKRVLARTRELQSLKKQNKNLKIGIIGCMAERMQQELFEKLDGVDLLAGPDSYRNLPQLLAQLDADERVSDVLLSTSETYEDIDPLRFQSNYISAFVSIMRGCNNFCTYCVVPYTRGRERSRPLESILKETFDLQKAGYKEITFLGQNVNSYNYIDSEGKQWHFPDLLAFIAKQIPEMRVRYATSHPKDISEELIDVMAAHENICNSLHLPIQSGSTAVLEKMNRKYTREDYLKKVVMIKSKIPDMAISTDIIAGFCGEIDEDHKMTLSAMREVDYYYAFMFKYSERPGTHAAKSFDDDVPENVKGLRLQEIIELQQSLSLRHNKRDIDKTFEVLVEGFSKKSELQLFGRTPQNKVVVFDKGNAKPSEFVKVIIEDCTAATLIGRLV